MQMAFPLERITYMQGGKQEVFEEIWAPFIRFNEDFDIQEEEP